MKTTKENEKLKGIYPPIEIKDIRKRALTRFCLHYRSAYTTVFLINFLSLRQGEYPQGERVDKNTNRSSFLKISHTATPFVSFVLFRLFQFMFTLFTLCFVIFLYLCRY